MKKLTSLLGSLFALFLMTSAVQADVVYEERVLGDPNAPVTIIEYASFTCPHCGTFHNETLPQIKKEYVDTGKAKIIFRDFPFERVGATAAMLTRCVEPSRYYGFVELLFKQQAQWSQSPNPLASLFKLSKLAGMSQAKIDACLASESLLDKIISVRKEAMDNHEINSTPSFLVNGEKVVGAASFDSFKSVIESKL